MTDDSADEPLSGAEVLTHAGLYRPRTSRDTGADGPVRETGVRCGRPIVYPVPTDDLPPPLRLRAASAGHRYLGALFAFDLDDLGPGRWYCAARFSVTLADPRALAVQVYPDGGAFGLVYGTDGPVPVSTLAAHTVGATGARPGLLRRLLLRRGRPRAWASGVLTNDFGWVYEDPHGTLLVPRTHAMHALLEVPAELDRLDGTLSVRVEVVREVRGVRAYERASLREAVSFTEPATSVGHREAAAVRLCMAVDVSKYSQLRNSAAERVQRDLVSTLARARRDAGLDESAVARQPQGDGQFSVFPPGIDEAEVIPRLVNGLGAALTEANRGAVDGSRMRLRVALHRGLVKEGDNGWIGNAAIAVHRILDSPPVRRALADDAAADFVLGVPDVLYRDVIVHTTPPPDPTEFREIVVDLPDKKFLENGWLYVSRGENRASG